MDVELSRRAARAFQSPVITSLDPFDRGQLARRIDAAAGWDDLSDKDRELIRRVDRRAITLEHGHLSEVV